MFSEKFNRIGLIVGREQDWPNAFIAAVDERDEGITAELIKVGGTFMNDVCPYPVIIDRMSQIIPFFRSYVKHAAMHGSYIINDPFVWSSDSRFFGTAVANRLGLTSPRTIVLPNKEVELEVVPDSFRNLVYPMDWQGIIDYIGVPAIFKEVRSGGRLETHRVYSVDDLIQLYDESGTRTVILQEVIQGKTYPLLRHWPGACRHFNNYSTDENRYMEKIQQENENFYSINSSALAISKVYGYDINMIEFIATDDELYVINSTNPAPVMDRQLMSEPEFNWLVEATVSLAVERVKNPLPQRVTFNFNKTF